MELCKRDGIPWADIQYELDQLQVLKGTMQKRKGSTPVIGGGEGLSRSGKPWAGDVEFAQWVLSLSKVPDKRLVKMHEWFHWDKFRGNAAFDDGLCRTRVTQSVTELNVESAEFESESWTIAAEVFAAMYWEDNVLGGFTHDVCRAGGVDLLGRFLGASVPLSVKDMAKLDEARLWLHPVAHEAAQLVKSVEAAWYQSGKSVEATLLVSQGTATQLELADNPLWRLHTAYAPGLPLMSSLGMSVSSERLEFWCMAGTSPVRKMEGVIDMKEAEELERADKAASAPKSAEEAAEREWLKQQPIHVSVDALKRWGFPPHIIEWFESGVPLGVSRQFGSRYEKHYPIKDHEELAAAITEVDRMLAIQALEEVTEDSLENATVVSPWVIVRKGGKTRVCCDVLLNEMLRSPAFALPCFRDCLQYLKPGSFIAIADARDFFYAIPVKGSDRRYLAVRHPKDGRLLRYARIPMGLGSAPFVACSFSEAIAAKLREAGHKVLVYCDDWAAFGDTKLECQLALDALLEMLNDLGVSVAPHKLKFPAQRQTWLGIEIDTRLGHGCFRVTASRVKQMETEMQEFREMYAGKDVCSPRQLASIIGRCGFLSQIIPDGNVHMRRLYDVMKYASVNWVTGEVISMWGAEPVPLTAGLWRDLEWWHKNLRYRNHTPLFMHETSWKIILMGTDASDWGGGGEIEMDVDTEEMRFP
jgi:hypothetical protein